jgi:hypothetical protein
MEARTHILHLRLNDSEMRQLKQEAEDAHATLSQLVRSRCFNGHAPDPMSQLERAVRLHTQQAPDHAPGHYVGDTCRWCGPVHASLAQLASGGTLS